MLLFPTFYHYIAEVVFGIISFIQFLLSRKNYARNGATLKRLKHEDSR
jgi:hypothetical protein